jgi:hypothetical protein
MAGSFFSQMMGQYTGANLLNGFGGGVQTQAPQGSLGSAGVPTATAGAGGANGAPAPSTGGSEQGRTNTPPPVQQYLPQTNPSVNKDEIKSTSAFGNARASEGFATHEVTHADKSVKDQAIKAGLIVVSGALLWANGGVVKQVNAQQQNCGDGGMTMVIDGGLMCANGSGGLRPYGSHPDDGYGPRPNNGARNTNNSNGGFDVPTRQKPSSYGAVAWDLKKSLLGRASKQASKPL